MDSFGLFLCLLLPPLCSFIHLLYSAAGGLLGAGELVLHAVYYPCRRNTAVAYGRIEIVYIVVRNSFEKLRENFFIQNICRSKASVFELILEYLSAPDDILLASFLLVPLLYLSPGAAALCYVQPVTARSGSAFGGAYLNYVSVLQDIVKVDYPSVYLGSDHMIADIRMYGVGEVYRGRSCRQIYHVSFGREYENIVREHVYLQVVEKVLGVGLLLAFEQSSDPGELILLPFPYAGGGVHFIFPMRSDSVLSRAVHFPCPDLHFKRNSLGAYYRGMYALIHIRFRSGDIVFESAGNRLEHLMYDTKHIVAV